MESADRGAKPSRAVDTRALPVPWAVLAWDVLAWVMSFLAGIITPSRCHGFSLF